MTIYAMTDVTSITIPADRGGCGDPHTRPGDLPAGERFTVTCPQCEPVIIAGSTGWAHTPDGVRLTCDEIALVEVDEARAKREQNRTWGDPKALGAAFAEALSAQMAPPPAGEPPSLLAQIAALSPEERLALGQMLAPPPATTVTVSGAASLVTFDPASDAPGESAAQAPAENPKRAPGRPRKQPA